MYVACLWGVHYISIREHYFPQPSCGCCRTDSVRLLYFLYLGKQTDSLESFSGWHCAMTCPRSWRKPLLLSVLEAPHWGWGCFDDLFQLPQLPHPGPSSCPQTLTQLSSQPCSVTMCSHHSKPHTDHFPRRQWDQCC